MNDYEDDYKYAENIARVSIFIHKLTMVTFLIWICYVWLKND